MTNFIVSDKTRAEWPDAWPTDESTANQNETTGIISQIFQRFSNYLHNQAAHHILPSLNLKEEDLDDLDQKRLFSIISADRRIKRANFITADNLTLDGAIIWNSINDAEQEVYTEKPWVLYFNGNSETYEYNLDMLLWYSEQTGCNMICFNYRGVGHSDGFPYHAYDLSLDGDAVFEFLLRRNVQSKDILIHARSLGGAVGTRVRKMHPDGPLCNERSFDQWMNLEREFHGKTYSFLMSYFLYFTNWEFDPIKDWKSIKGKKWIIVSLTDEIINYEKASFYKKLKRIMRDSGINSTEEPIQVIKLPKQYSWRSHLPEGHNIPLRDKEFVPSWEEHKRLVKDCFN